MEIIVNLKCKHIDNEKAVDWLESNGYCSAETVFMLTEECPLCVVNNVETYLNL